MPPVQKEKQEFTFIKYNDVKDLKYRKEAREHIARKRVIQGDLERERRDHADWSSWTRRRAIAEGRPVNTSKTSSASPPSLSPESSINEETSQQGDADRTCKCHSEGGDSPYCANCGSRTIVFPKQSLQSAVSSFSRDQFNVHPFELSTDDQMLRTYWQSSMNQVLYFAELPAQSKLVSPLNAFYSASLQSKTVFLGLVLLPAATARAKVFGTTTDMHLRGAVALRSYNGLVDYFHENSGQLTMEDITGIYAVSCAFLDKRYEEHAAYEAVMRSNSGIKLSHSKSGHRVNIVPVLEWMRIVLPTLVSTSPRFGADAFKPGFIQLFRFFSSAHELALEHASLGAIGTRSMRIALFRPGTSLHTLMTTPVKGYQGRQPYPTFYEVVLCRLLVYLHAHFLRLCRCNLEQQTKYLQSLNAMADACCASLQGVEALGMFFWCTLAQPDLLDHEISCLLTALNIPLKKWYANGWYDINPDMLAWLLQAPDADGNVNLPAFDLEALRRRVWAEMGWNPDDN